MAIVTQGLGTLKLLLQGFGLAAPTPPTRNMLHNFLHAGNVQARPVLGELFNYGSQTGLTGFFTPADEKIQMELVGYLDEIDTVAVVDLDQFDTGNEPAVLALILRNGATYSVRSLKTDQSAYVLGLKKITT